MSSVRLSGLSAMSFAPASVRRGSSVHGGAGGRHVRVSYASNGPRAGFDLASALADDVSSISVSGNGKVTMQDLNARLAAYLEKVRALESANAQLERQIRDWHDKQTPTQRDYGKYEGVIGDLRQKMSVAAQDNARLMLQIDNAKLAGEDFRLKFESELAMRVSVETDSGGLRRVLDELTVTRSDLELQVEGLKEELVYLKKNHQEELAVLRDQVTSRSVKVEVEAKPQEDLSGVLEELRGQYHAITDKNRREVEAWYQVKFAEVNKVVASSSGGLETSRSQIGDLRRTLSGLEIQLESQRRQKSAAEGQLDEAESRCGVQLRQLQMLVDRLEGDLQQVRVDVARQDGEYQMLLDIKTRLELEIAEYRRLLEGEEAQKTITVVEVVEEKRKPVISQRKKVVIEELVDGEVVSRTVDEDTEVIIE